VDCKEDGKVLFTYNFDGKSNIISEKLVALVVSSIYK
jgi:hypothetical protein